MKKTFVTPTMQIILPEVNDILTLSLGTKAGDNDFVVDLKDI